MLNFNRILLNSNNDKINISYPEDTHHIQHSIHTQIFDPWVMAVPVVCLDSCLLLAFKSYGHKREFLLLDLGANLALFYNKHCLTKGTHCLTLVTVRSVH